MQREDGLVAWLLVRGGAGRGPGRWRDVIEVAVIGMRGFWCPWFSSDNINWRCGEPNPYR